MASHDYFSMEIFFSFYDTTVNRDCELGEWSNWTEPFGFGIIERVRLVNLKELGNGTKCPVVRETKEARELNNKIRIVFKMSLSNISVL